MDVAIELAGVALKRAVLVIKMDGLALKRADVAIQTPGVVIRIAGACCRAGGGLRCLFCLSVSRPLFLLKNRKYSN